MIDRRFDPFVTDTQSIGAFATKSEVLGRLEHERCTWDFRSMMSSGLTAALREASSMCCEPKSHRRERAGSHGDPFY